MRRDENKGTFPQRIYRHAFPIINDPRVTLRSKALWFYMRMKPQGWDFAAERIAHETKDGVKSIRNGFDELEYCGYLKRNKLPSGRCSYQLFEEQFGPGAPYEGDYDFEISRDFSPWRDDAFTRDSRCPDASCTVGQLAEHLIFAYGLDDARGRYEAEEWKKACIEGGLAMTWRTAAQWAEHMEAKYSQSA